MKLRVGLIGLGRSWQQRHAPILRALADRFEVRAICDQIAHRAEQAAREFNARPVYGYRALVKCEDVDAILILAPQWYGALPVLAACDAGKAVYCAVALEIDAQQAEAIKRRVEESGIAFVAELPKRYSPATLRLKELIATHLGPPKIIFCHQRISVDRKQQETQDPSEVDAARNAPMHRMIELVDWCRYVVGRDPDAVTGVAHASPAGPYKNDYEMISLRFAGGNDDQGESVTAQISCGHYLPADWPEAISFRRPAALQVVCEKGVAFVDLPSSMTWFDRAGRHLESLETDRPVGEQLFLQFFRAVTSLVQRSSDLKDAYEAMRIVLAGRKSQEKHGESVKL